MDGVLDHKIHIWANECRLVRHGFNKTVAITME